MHHFQALSTTIQSLIAKVTDHLPSDIKNAESLNKYIRNTAWLCAEKVLRLILGVWILIWMARYLGPAKFGLLNYAISFVGLFSAFASLGIDNILVKELTLNPDKENVLLGSAFLLKLIGSISAVIFTAAACILINNSQENLFLILVSAITLLVHPFLVFEFYFRSIVRSQYYAWAMMIALIIGLIIRILLIYNEFSIVYFAVVPSIELAIVGMALSCFYVNQNKSVWRWRVTAATVGHLLIDSWPLFFSGAMISIYMRIDQVMIQNMLGDEAVGYYSAAVRISEAWYFIPMVICQSALPSIINTRRFDRRLYEKRLQRLFNFMIAVSLSVAIPMSLFAGYLIPLLYGAAYIPATAVFQIHIWAGIFVSLGVAGSNWLLAENLQRYFFFNVVLGAVTNVLLNIVLIRSLSYYGAAIATIISYSISGYFGLLFFKKTRPCFRKITRSFLIFKWFAADS